MIHQRAIDAVEVSDTDELLRIIDGYCESRDWDTLVDLRWRCREAVTRGKQLWGVEEHIRYRLALEAPAQWAGPVVTEGPARFAPGPLAEVAASTKTWADLDPHLRNGPERTTVAAERVVRGEKETGADFDLADGLTDWEPEYMVATYKPDRVDAPSPPPPDVREASLPSTAERIEDVHSEGALADLAQPWVEESNGNCETVSVTGTAAHAIRALGLSAARVSEIEPRSAMQWMAWAGASGGAHGRRRGAAAGRYAAWWAVATLADLEWPAEPDDVGRALGQLRWYWFDDGSPGTGWQLRIAVEDPTVRLAWAVAAVDAAA